MSKLMVKMSKIEDTWCVFVQFYCKFTAKICKSFTAAIQRTKHKIQKSTCILASAFLLLIERILSARQLLSVRIDNIGIKSILTKKAPLCKGGCRFVDWGIVGNDFHAIVMAFSCQFPFHNRVLLNILSGATDLYATFSGLLVFRYALNC